MTDTNAIDPTKPLHPLIVSYPVPGVCAAQWLQRDDSMDERRSSG